MWRSGNTGREDKYANENGNARRIDRCDWPRVCWGEPHNGGNNLMRWELRFLCDFKQVVIKLSSYKVLLDLSYLVFFPMCFLFYFDYLIVGFSANVSFPQPLLFQRWIAKPYWKLQCRTSKGSRLLRNVCVFTELDTQRMFPKVKAAALLGHFLASRVLRRWD